MLERLKQWLRGEGLFSPPPPPQKPARPQFVRTGICPVCGGPSQVFFTQGKGTPYESCEAHRIQSVAIMVHNTGGKVIRMKCD